MVDLHTHSTYSDGTVSPTTLLTLAEEAGVTAIVLSDHNTVAGLPEFMTAAKGKKVEAIPGIEFSTDYGDTELHILGLFIHPEHYDTINVRLNEMMARKEQSNVSLIRALNEAGMCLDYEQIKSGTPGGNVNRAVIAAEMTRLGYTETVQDAFARWLSPKHGYFQPPRRLDAFETIRFIKSIGAVAVLAHPFLNLKEADELRTFLHEAKAAGLDGMETRYSKFDAVQTELAKQIAEEFELLESGGSDFHGENKPDIKIGTGKGTLDVPDEFLAKLKTRICQNHVSKLSF